MEKRELLKTVITQQYRNCVKDPIHFITKYCYVQHPMKGKVLFDLYDFQEKTLNSIIDKDRTVILKGRQLGLSTLIAAYALWLILFHWDKRVLVIATKESVAKKLVAKVEYMYNELPKWLQTPLKEKSQKKKMVFVNRSEINAEAATKDAGRGDAISLLIIDEMAFIPNNLMEEIWKSSTKTLATGGQGIYISTPNGKGNRFYKIYTEAEQGINGFHYVKLPWYVHPDRDQAWRDNEDIELGIDGAAQENDCSFLSSGRSVIHYKKLGEYKNQCIDPIEKRYADQLWIWKLPEEGKSYVVSADVARGDGSDYSAFHVLDALNLEQVAEFKGKATTNYYANILYSIASEYNDALLVVENASQGWAVLDHLINKKYRNLYYSIKGELVLSLNLAELMNRTLDSKYEPVPGWTTSRKTRPVILENLKKLVVKDEIKINSIRTVNELDTFVWTKSGKQEADIGYNDDLVMSLAIGLWVREIALKLKIEGTNLTKAILNNTTTTINSGIYTRYGAENPYVKNIKGQHLDLREWLK